MNKNILIFIGILAIMAVVLVTDIILQNGPLTKNAVVASIVSVKESSDIYTINAEYPQFKGADVLNQKISDLTQNHIKDFKKNSDDTWKAMNETASTEYPLPEKSSDMFYDQVTWEPIQVNSKYISIVLNVNYFSGGAHGSEEIYTFNYDVNKKEMITTEKLLTQESLDKISKMAKDYISLEVVNREMILDESLSSMIAEGTAATYENYKDFTFDSNRIDFYFQKYQVAPGVAGSFVFTVYKPTFEENNIDVEYLK
jgi:hypothetical protein